MAQVHLCDQTLRARDSGLSADGTHFQQAYNIHPHFNLACVGCCIAYLNIERRYTIYNADFDIVVFPASEQPAGIENTACRVNVPGGGGKRGQIMTGSDINIGTLGPRVFCASKTYQFYNDNEDHAQRNRTLSVGFVTPARLESVAIEVVKIAELNTIQMNYADASLVELYRQSLQRPLGSLYGQCWINRHNQKQADTESDGVKPISAETSRLQLGERKISK